MGGNTRSFPKAVNGDKFPRCCLFVLEHSDPIILVFGRLRKIKGSLRNLNLNWPGNSQMNLGSWNVRISYLTNPTYPCSNGRHLSVSNLLIMDHKSLDHGPHSYATNLLDLSGSSLPVCPQGEAIGFNF